VERSFSESLLFANDPGYRTSSVRGKMEQVLPDNHDSDPTSEVGIGSAMEVRSDKNPGSSKVDYSVSKTEPGGCFAGTWPDDKHNSEEDSCAGMGIDNTVG